MSKAKILSGKDTALSVYNELNKRIVVLADKGIRPGLCVILIGDDLPSQIYVRTKTKKLKSLGLLSEAIFLSRDVSEKKIIKIINDLNNDTQYHGILVQLPLPDHINSQNIINAINPEKDVDGFHPENAGWLAIGKPRFIPCTPKGIMRFFEYYAIDISGKHIVVVGRSNIVGRPISILTSLKNKYSNATTTICHSGTPNIYHYTKMADVVILALGSPNFLKSDHIKDGSIIIDVGINRIKNNNNDYKLVGDADYNSVIDKVSAITPVPGGVGPMTIAMLVENTIEASERLL